MSVNELIKKPFSDIKSINFHYKDNNLKLKNTHYTTSENFNFKLYDAFDNFNDLTINNYSCFILGKNNVNDTWSTFNTKNNSIQAYITSIKYVLNGENIFLMFDDESVKNTPNLIDIKDAGITFRKSADLKISGIDEDDILSNNNFLFAIELIPGTDQCYIKHYNGSEEYVLYNRKLIEQSTGIEGEHTDDLWFTTNKEYYEKFGRFNFILNGNDIILYLVEKSFIKISKEIFENSSSTFWIDSNYNLEKLPEISVDNLKIKNPTIFPENIQYKLPDGLVDGTILNKNEVLEVQRIRTLAPYMENDELKLGLFDNKRLTNVILTPYGLSSCVSIINARKNIIDINNYTNSSWISYDNKNSGTINSLKSAFNMENQCLYHMEYNNIDKDYSTTLDIIPLKNHISPQNFAIRGDYMLNGNIYEPNVNFREYTTLETGTDQEFGNSNITLNYTYYVTEYIVAAGEDLAFTIKSNSNNGGEFNLDSILYPYIYLNINDSNFIKNGANGSSIPFLSDKVKKFQSNSQFNNNGRYLYTWLYQNNENPYGIWLDRYYYPDRIKKEEILKSAPNLKDGSFNDIIDKDYVQSGNIGLQDNLTYFDKQSDLMFEPNTKYVYSRIDESHVDEILKDIDDTKITSIKSFNSGDGYKSFNADILKNKGVLDLNFDMYINPDKKFGTDIISNSANTGLVVRQNSSITPFSYIFDRDNFTISMVNYNMEIIKTISLLEIYSFESEDDLKINRVISGNVYDNVIVITNRFIILLGYDLIIKDKFILPSDDKLSTLIYSLLNDNNFYMIFADLDDKIHHVICFDLISGTFKEIIKFNQANINNLCLAQKDDIIVPISKNLVKDNGDGTFIVIEESEDNYEQFIPFGLSAGDIVSINEVNEYNPEYFYYAPVFNKDLIDRQANTLYIDKNNIIYCFPHYLYVQSEIDNTIYGIRERINDNLFQVEVISINDYKTKINDSGDFDILFASYNKIIDIACDSTGRLAILKDNRGTEELILFDKTKRRIKNIKLGNTYNKCFALDTFHTYIKGYELEYFGLIAKKESGNYYFITFDDTFTEQDTELLYNISESNISYKTNKTCLSNFSKILEYGNTDELKFMLNLPKYNLLGETITYSLSPSELIRGWYNFRIYINLNEGIFEVYMNDKLLNVKNNFDFTKYIYNFKNIFNYPLTLGSAMYKNSSTIGTFTKLTEDCFECINVRIKNIFAYAKNLTEAEKQAIKLKVGGIKPVTITLPTGQKNNTEEIIRFFKYNQPYTMSNSIRINIKNALITDYNTKQAIIDDINKFINDKVSLPLTIKEINFI